MGEKLRRLVVSFSGGETSGYMLAMCKQKIFDKYDEVKVVFANTGQENEETLVFVDKCSRYFGVDVIWLQAKVNQNMRKATGFDLVNFVSADRAGVVFEDVIKKYGIPNQSYPHCTRELKLNPITSYLRSIGWKNKSYDTAVGIRVDEIDRMDGKASEKGIIYPLISLQPTTKQMINSFWGLMPFRLGLKGYQGNCKWCWKKSLRKHFTIMQENPSFYDFPERMERLHGDKGANQGGKFVRVFFRNNKSTQDLRQMYINAGNFVPARDDSELDRQCDWVGFDEMLDMSGDCSESCEVVF